MTDHTEHDNTATAEVGPRGHATVTSDNRGAVRRWLIARGLPSAYVRSLTLAELATAYNDTTDATLRRMASTSATTELLPLPETVQPAPAATVRTSTPSADPAAALTAAITSAISGAMATMPRDSIDAEQVRAIVRAEMANAARTVVEIRTPDTVRAVEGLHHAMTAQVLAYLSAGCSVWLVGPAGTGKSTFGRIAAKAFDVPFYSTGAVQSEYKLTGFTDAHGRTVRTAFREAWEHGGVFAFDDVDASNPNAVAVFNEALANGRANFPDGAIERHPKCYILASANTYGTGPSAEYVGRIRQDAATLDRFEFVEIDYDRALERAIADSISPKHAAAWCARVWKCREKAAAAGVRAIFSTRAIVSGCRLLEAGVALDDVIAVRLRRGLDAATWAKVSG